MANVSTVVLVAALIAAGLVAGLFYAYACSVMPGLARGDDRTYVEAMRGINVAIINPVFMLTFLGAPVLTAAATILYWGSPRLPWLITAFVLLVAMLVITGAANIPLNNAIERADDDYPALRARFESPWIRWNLLRTATTAAAFACLVAAALTPAS